MEAEEGFSNSFQVTVLTTLLHNTRKFRRRCYISVYRNLTFDKPLFCVVRLVTRAMWIQ